MKIIKSIIIALTLILAHETTFGSDRKVLCVPFDCHCEMPFYPTTAPFMEHTQFGSIHVELTKRLYDKCCPILAPKNLVHTVMLMRYIVSSVIDEKCSFAEFNKRFKHIPQFRMPVQSMMYFNCLVQLKLFLNCWPYYTQYIAHSPGKKEEKASSIFTMLHNSYPILMEDSQHAKAIERYMIAYSSQFDPDEWLIKEASDNFYLLIPESYLDNLRKKNPTKNYDELLEMNLSEFSDISSATLYEKALSTVYVPVPQARAELINLFHQKVLFKQPDLLTNKTWTIILSGHGIAQSQNQNLIIAGLEHKEFLQLCTNLEKYTPIKRLALLSCCSGGHSSFRLFQDENAQQRSFSYDIFTVGIDNAPSYNFFSGLRRLENPHLFDKTLNIVPYITSKFAALSNMISPKKKDFDIFINVLWPYYDHYLCLNNLPLFRAAKSTKTVPLENRGIVHRIPSTLLDSEVPFIDITYPSLPRAIVIERDTINSELIVPKTAQHFPIFVSHINAEHPHHYIKKITAQKFSHYDILANFFYLRSPWGDRAWFIKELENQNSIFYNVLLVQTDRKNGPNYNVINYTLANGKHVLVEWNGGINNHDELRWICETNQVFLSTEQQKKFLERLHTTTNIRTDDFFKKARMHKRDDDMSTSPAKKQKLTPSAF